MWCVQYFTVHLHEWEDHCGNLHQAGGPPSLPEHYSHRLCRNAQQVVMPGAKVGWTSAAFNSVACQHVFIIPKARSTTERALERCKLNLSWTRPCRGCLYGVKRPIVFSGKDGHHPQGGSLQGGGYRAL